jgi:hypothetical protein
VEEEEAEQELIWHAGDERVLAHEGGHDGLCGHHSDTLFEKDLLESASVVVGMAMCEDHMCHLRDEPTSRPSSSVIKAVINLRLERPS